jgi:N-acetylmuramoyl-L-alanine amidase
MIIISRKRAGIILSCLIVSLFAFSFQIANNQKTTQMSNIENNIMETASTPVSGKTIVVDAGHGKPDERSCLLTLKITLIFYKK